MHSESTFNAGFLTIDQRYAEKPDEVFRGNFDVGVVVPSWDPRSTEVVRASTNSTVAVLPLLRNRGVTGKRAAHEEQLLTYFQSTSEEVHTLESSSEDVERTFESVFSAVAEVVKRLDRSINLFIELSTCPRYLSLGISMLMLRRGWAHEICFGYSAAEYGVAPHSDPLADIFTLGRWDTIAVPGLEGWHDPGKSRCYLVAVGFEGAKTYRLISSADPDRVAVLFPDPGVRDYYVERAREENSETLTHFVASETDVVRAGAADVVSCMTALENAQLEEPRRENTFYLTCGTKPQSLALALRAFYLDYPALLYPVPLRHRETTVTTLPMHWSYTVRDRSAIVSRPR